MQHLNKLFFKFGAFICADTVYIAYIQYDFNNLTFTMYSSVLIAGQFVNLGVKENNPVTQMKLQKMVFFAHGLHLALNNGDPLIREKFLAWKFGPVVPTIY